MAPVMPSVPLLFMVNSARDARSASGACVDSGSCSKSRTRGVRGDSVHVLRRSRFLSSFLNINHGRVEASGYFLAMIQSITAAITIFCNGLTQPVDRLS